MLEQLQNKDWSKKSLDWCIEQCKKLVIMRDGLQCAKCGISENQTLDHIIPKSWLVSFGIEHKNSYMIPELFQLLCRRCNILKQDRLDWGNPKTKKILRQLIDEI